MHNDDSASERKNKSTKQREGEINIEQNINVSK